MDKEARVQRLDLYTPLADSHGSHIPSETSPEQDMYSLPGNGGVPLARTFFITVLFGLFGGDIVYSSPAVGPSISLPSSLLLFVLLKPQIFMQWGMFPHSPRNGTIGCQYSVHLPSSAPSCVFHGHLQGQNINFSVKSIDSMTTTTLLV